MDNSQTPVEELINAGFGRRFFGVFGIPILFSNATDKKSVYSSKLKQNPNLKLPFAFASLSTQAITDSRYSPTTLLRRGLYGSASHDNVQTYRLRLLPVTTTLQITVLTSDLESATRFSKRWLMAATEGSLKFGITYGIVDLQIHIEMDKEVQIPPRTGGVDESPEYELTATLRMEGYMSKDLERAQAATTVEVEGVVGSEDQIAAALAGDPRGTTQVFKFNKSWDNT